MLVYVDDLIISGNDSGAILRFKRYLGDCFHMKDLGVLKYFGIEIARGPEGLFLCQCKYTLNIISETGLMGAKPAAFPLEQNHALALATGDLLSDPESYRRFVGRALSISPLLVRIWCVLCSYSSSVHATPSLGALGRDSTCRSLSKGITRAFFLGRSVICLYNIT